MSRVYNKQHLIFDALAADDQKEYGEAIYHRLEYLLNDIRSNIEASSNEKNILFQNKNELKIYCNQLKADVVDRLQENSYESLFNKIEIYENQYLKLLKAKADYEDLCERFIDLLSTYENLNKSKAQQNTIFNPHRYFNNMLINFELLRRSLTKQKTKYEKLILKQKRLIVSNLGQLYFVDGFVSDSFFNVKSILTDKNLELTRLFDFKNFNLTYNQLERVRDVYLDDDCVYVCCTPFYYSEYGLIIEKFDKNTQTLLKSVEIERKYSFRSVCFDSTSIILLVKSNSQLFSYVLQVYNMELNMQTKLMLNFGTNILSINVLNDKIYIFNEFYVYIYNKHDLKEIFCFKLNYDNYSSIKYCFSDQDFYRANIFLAKNEIIYYQDNSLGLSLLQSGDSPDSLSLFSSFDLIRFKNYEFAFVDDSSRVYLLHTKQKSLIIASLVNKKLEILDEYYLGNISSISSIYVTNGNILVINDFANYKVYYYKIDF